MPTYHAQRVARAARLHTVRSLTFTALLARAARLAYLNKELTTPWLDEPLPWEDAPMPRPVLTLTTTTTSDRDRDDRAWDEALRADDDATTFMPEDWREDDIPDYMGGDLDGLFL